MPSSAGGKGSAGGERRAASFFKESAGKCKCAGHLATMAVVCGPYFKGWFFGRGGRRRWKGRAAPGSFAGHAKQPEAQRRQRWCRQPPTNDLDYVPALPAP
ncbi:hypothetical protein KM043_007977 [Ampulex compressa]|nr:hypothetical protein KM043_007977 [Ampulex compressa]